MAKPVLYSYWRSSCSWRVRIALNLKEIPYDIKAVSLIKGGGEQHCNEYREVNPMEQVPSLVIDGHTLIESLSIMHYLEETRPQRALLPQDCYKRAKVREICEGYPAIQGAYMAPGYYQQYAAYNNPQAAAAAGYRMSMPGNGGAAGGSWSGAPQPVMYASAMPSAQYPSQ